MVIQKLIKKNTTNAKVDWPDDKYLAGPNVGPKNIDVPDSTKKKINLKIINKKLQ